MNLVEGTSRPQDFSAELPDPSLTSRERCTFERPRCRWGVGEKTGVEDVG